MMKGRPSFNKLQNYGTAAAPLHFFIFDVLILMGKNVMNEPLVRRRELIEEHVLPTLADPIRYSPILDAPLEALIRSVKDQGLEGLIAKRRGSKYEPGERSGAWQKMRINRSQELVIAGYTPSAKNFDALVIGYYDDSALMYAARTRNGFTPASRAELFKRMKPLEINECPFANLPEREGRPLGRRTNRFENDRVPLVEAEARRAIRVRGVDQRQSPSSYEFRWIARRQECERCTARVRG